MIYETDIAPGMDKRTAVECDKPGCPTSEWMPGVGSHTAAGRMRSVGWEVSHELTSSEVDGRQVRGFASRCPEHAAGPAPTHEHSWNYNLLLNVDVCRTCGTRRSL